MEFRRPEISINGMCSGNTTGCLPKYASTGDFLSCIYNNSSTGYHCRFLALPRPGLALYRHCIDLETNLASIGDKDGLINARKLYESALATYDQNVSLWQDYYRMETKVKAFFSFFFPLWY